MSIKLNIYGNIYEQTVIKRPLWTNLSAVEPSCILQWSSI